ncbi:ribosome maturation factor RimM [Terriglobus sp. RCC_193]|uniref:ribosome maturation factor RimM n=1 Tax=Terriglobus sp. RCC_193 TaxID=3239218 RepID=UPI003523D96B
MAEEWISLARVVRPQGRRGEVLADLKTDFPDHFREYPNIFLRLPECEPQPVVVEDSWLPTGRSAGRIVLKLRGVDSISDAEKLLNATIEIASNQRLTLSNGNYYVSDLIGCQMVHHGDLLGTVVDMHFPQDPAGKRIEDAAALFVVERANGDEVLIPFANAFVTGIDTAARKIEMNLPDGLLEMNG